MATGGNTEYASVVKLFAIRFIKQCNTFVKKMEFSYVYAVFMFFPLRSCDLYIFVGIIPIV